MRIKVLSNELIDREPSILIKDSRNILINTPKGFSKVLGEEKVDTIFITHGHPKNIGGIEEIIKYSKENLINCHCSQITISHLERIFPDINKYLNIIKVVPGIKVSVGEIDVEVVELQHQVQEGYDMLGLIFGGELVFATPMFQCSENAWNKFSKVDLLLTSVGYIEKAKYKDNQSLKDLESKVEQFNIKNLAILGSTKMVENFLPIPVLKVGDVIEARNSIKIFTGLNFLYYCRRKFSMEVKKTNIPVTFDLELVKTVTKKNDKFHVVGYATTSDLDRQNQIITEKALQKATKDLLLNSTVFLNHNYDRAIGKVEETEFVRGKIKIDAYISAVESDVTTKIQEGIYNAFSIGGTITEIEEVTIKGKKIQQISALEILEVSLVGVPANPQAKVIDYYFVKALNTNIKEGAIVKEIEKEKDVKKVEVKETPENDKVKVDVEKTSKPDKEVTEDKKSEVKEPVKDKEEDKESKIEVKSKIEKEVKEPEIEKKVLVSQPYLSLYNEDIDAIVKDLKNLEVGEQIKLTVVAEAVEKIEYKSGDEVIKIAGLKISEISVAGKVEKVEEVEVKKETEEKEVKKEPEVKVEKKPEVKVEKEPEAEVEKEPEVKVEKEIEVTRKGEVVDKTKEQEKNLVLDKIKGKSPSEIMKDSELFDSLPDELQKSIKALYWKNKVL